MSTRMCLACRGEFEGEIETCPQDGTALILLNKSDPLLATTIRDKYVVKDVVARVGFATVYGVDADGRDFLLFLYQQERGQPTGDELEAWNLLGHRLLKLHHPNIIPLVDFGYALPGQRFVVYERLRGATLDCLIEGQGPLAIDRAVRLFTDVCDALAHAHNQDVLHRNIATGSIVVDGETASIFDFELCEDFGFFLDSQTKCQELMVHGPILNMSPEACMGKTLTVQSDLYMLGTCLFIAITGKPPFRGSNSIQTASKHMIEPVPRLREVNPALEVGGKFEAFITKALAKDPDQRYASALEFKEAMLAASKH